MAVSEQQKVPIRPIIPSMRYDLVEPTGIGTGLVEASSSLWKRAAERASVGFSDFVRWAFNHPSTLSNSSRKGTRQRALSDQFAGVDGASAGAEMCLSPLRRLIASDRVEACTLIPFAGLVSPWHLLRRYRAWCPLCLASMLSGPGVYEPLLWRLPAVTMCPVHGIDLVTVCHVCMAPRQNIVGPFARVGCCNRCGTWMGTAEAAHGIRHAEESEANVASAIMDLLSRTATFENDDFDGHSTLQKLLPFRGVRDILISEYGISPASIKQYSWSPALSRLAFLAKIACLSQQPLYRVILGQLVPWNDANTPCVAVPKLRGKRDWGDLEGAFRMLANGQSLPTVEDACKQLKISAVSARNHFPALVDRLAKRRKMLMSKAGAAREKTRSDGVRKAFRALVEAGEYPSYRKLQKISGVNIRHISERFKGLMDEEWIRAEGTTSLSRRRRAANLT